MARIKDSIWIAAPPERVGGVGTDPHGWSNWFSGLEDAQKVAGDGGPGTVVEHGYLLAGMRFPVVTKVTENTVDAGGARHWKSSFEGPLAGWQAWDYDPKEGGTQVTAEIDYAVPGTLLAKVAGAFVEKVQQRSLRHTLENLKGLLES